MHFSLLLYSLKAPLRLPLVNNWIFIVNRTSSSAVCSPLTVATPQRRFKRRCRIVRAASG